MSRRCWVMIFDGIEVQVTMFHVAMEWLTIKLVILASSVVAMDHGSLVVAIVISTLDLLSLYAVVRMGVVVSRPLHSSVGVG